MEKKCFTELNFYSFVNSLEYTKLFSVKNIVKLELRKSNKHRFTTNRNNSVFV